MTRKEIRKNFNDFRYLASTEHPDIIKEFVLYEEVIKLLKELKIIDND